jgi:TRAP-type C4-dicarboxylate transport system permease small subunit
MIGRALRAVRMLFVAAASLSLLSLTLMIVADTFFRFAFDAPFPASVEISQLIQPYVVVLPLAYALSSDSHVRVTLVVERIGGRARAWVDCVPYAVGTVFFSVMAVMSALNFWESFRVNETMLAAVTLYWWIGKLAMPLGTGLIAVECAYRLALAWPGARTASKDTEWIPSRSG